MVGQKIVESVLRHHLPLPLPDDTVMCMCHCQAANPPAIFDGPVFHRQHVAALVLDWLGRGEEEPSPYPSPEEVDMLMEFARREGLVDGDGGKGE